MGGVALRVGAELRGQSSPQRSSERTLRHQRLLLDFSRCPVDALPGSVLWCQAWPLEPLVHQRFHQTSTLAANHALQVQLLPDGPQLEPAEPKTPRTQS